MNLSPVRKETIVSPHHQSEVINQLTLLTTPPVLSKKDETPSALFVGKILKDTFKISLRINSPDNFLPIIYGKVEQTSIGSIVFLKFKLFFSSLMFLIFWSSVCLLAGASLVFIAGETLYGCLAFLIGLINYAVTLTNFNRKVRHSYQVLMEALKIDREL